MLQFIYKAIFVAILLGTSLCAPVVGMNVPAKFTVPEDSVAIDSLLLRINRASEKVSYSGVQMRFVRHRGVLVELRWQEYHWQPDRTVVIFLAPKDQRNSTIVLHGDQVRYKSNQHKDRTFHYGGPEEILKNGQLFKEIALLRRNYQVHVSPQPSFLDRPTLSLKVTPRHQGRPALQALIDAQSGFLLQVKRKAVGLPSDSFTVVNQFLEISFEKPDTTIYTLAWSGSKRLKESHKSKIYLNLDTLLTSYKGRALIPKNLPAGFALLQIKSFQRRGKTYLHFLYGDGLTFVSFFQNEEKRRTSHSKRSRYNNRRKTREEEREREYKKKNYKKVQHRGPFVIIRGKQDNISFSIIGEIPLTELTEMAESLGVMDKLKP